MTKQLKPFRLINDSELKFLHDDIKQKLDRWNAEYALFPLSFNLNRLSKINIKSHQAAIMLTENKPLALLMPDDDHLMKHCLFGDESACFNNASELLFIDLLKDLLGVTTLTRQSHSQLINSEDWFYKGSPALSLIFNSGSHIMTLYLHPQWVLAALPIRAFTLTSLEHFETALMSQTLDLHVELTPITLRVEDIMQLQIGNVIKTDHPLNQALQLKHQHKTLDYCQLGEQQSFKSIQISRPL